MRPADIAVLTRVNATLLGPMLLLGEAGIATSAPVDANFLERTGVAGALAWLRVAVAPEQLLPAGGARDGHPPSTPGHQPPSRRVGGRTAQPARSSSSWPGGSTRPATPTRSSPSPTTSGRCGSWPTTGAETAQLLEAIRDRVGLGQALDQRLDASRRSVDRSAHGDDLAALLAVAAVQPDPAEFPDWLADRLRIAPRPTGPVSASRPSIG